MNSALRLVCVGVLMWGVQVCAAADDDANSIQAFLQKNFDQRNAGMVVAVVDEHGTKFFAAGKLDNGTDEKVDADTVFEIGSVTKTFTALLVLDMVERGEMQLDDPVAKYLPDGVKMPTHDGKEITLLNLAAQDSGLPHDADNQTGSGAEFFSTYTVPKMYEFLSSYHLSQDPGEKFRYSNLGMGLLGHVISRHAGASFESLVVERICQPLEMESTRITLLTELKSRFAVGHDEAGNRTANYEMPAIAGAGALRSTANDLSKFVAAQIGLVDSPLASIVKKSHVVRHNDGQVRDPFPGHTAMPWFDEGVLQPPGTKLLGHAGGTGGYNSFVGFDLEGRRGVVVLTNQNAIHTSMLGWRILQHARLDKLDAQKMQPLREINGAGLALDTDKPTGMLRITKVLANSPAEKAGLTVGLLIRSVDGVSTKNKSAADCAAMIRGDAGTKLTLELADAGPNQTNSIELTRQTFLLDE
jgi:CubicO group peptidase (beta-lactamase class C family)